MGTVDIALIRENPVALRTVNRKLPEYLELVDSIREKGVLNPIVVREQVDAESGETYYGLVDGLHRFTASKDAGLSEVPVNIRNMDDAEVEEAQIVANLHKIETTAAQYSQQLARMLARNPTMTEAELAQKLSKSPTWLKDRLGLVKLHAKVAELVDDQKIALANAYALARLPEDEQLQFMDRAQFQQSNEFLPTVKARINELRDARRKGRDATPAEFVPQAYIQKISEIKAEMSQPNIGPTLCSMNNLTTPEQGFAMAVAWVMHMDPQSQDAQRIKDATRRQKLEEDKAARKAEREKKRAADALARTAEAQVNAEVE